MAQFLTNEDEKYITKIAQLIYGTEYPYKVSIEELSLEGKILREADLSQGLASNWFTQVVAGLSREFGISPIMILRDEEKFLTSEIPHITEGAKLYFPSKIKERVGQVKILLANQRFPVISY
jgi:hypothetical protein